MTGNGHPRAVPIARWAIALPASVGCHALVAVLLLRGGVDPGKMAEAAERMPPLEIPVKLGIEKSDAVTPSWLGFETPTPHVAAPSTTEQSPLTRAEGSQRDNFARTMAASLQASTAQALAEARTLLDVFRDRLAQSQAEARQRREAQAQEQTEAPAQPAEEPTPETVPAEPTPAQDDQGEGSPGIQDTRSAPPSSEPTDLRRLELGRVVSAQGLRINTTRMHLTSLQRAYRPSQSPLVEIFFDHEGKVSQARVPPGRGSGRSDIDQALINAIYEWTAQGEPIDQLQEGDAPLLIRMRILM